MWDFFTCFIRFTIALCYTGTTKAYLSYIGDQICEAVANSTPLATSIFHPAQCKIKYSFVKTVTKIKKKVKECGAGSKIL